MLSLSGLTWILKTELNWSVSLVLFATVIWVWSEQNWIDMFSHSLCLLSDSYYQIETDWNWLKLWNRPGVLFGVNFLKIIQDLCIWCVYVFVCEWERECEIIIYHFLFDAFLSIYCSNLSGSKIFETVENAWICCEITIIHT